MSTMNRRIREVRKRLGLKQEEFAARLGVSQGTVSRWETGPQTPDLDMRMKIGEMGGYDPIQFALYDEEHPFRASDWGMEVEVVGAVQANEWVESIEWEQDQKFKVQIPTPRDWPRFNISGYVVKDSSANITYPEGSVVFAAEVTQKVGGIRPKHGDMVVYARQDERGLFEVSLRVYYRNRMGEVFLHYASDRDEFGFGEHIELGKLSQLDIFAAGDYRGLGILGLVVASFTVEDPKRFAKEPEEGSDT